MKQDSDGDNNILVQSANVDLGDNFPDYAKTNIRQVASKYFGHLSLASVHVTREGITYRCTVNMQMGALKMMSGEAKDKDLYTAFRGALQKTAKQLRRSKRELREDKAERIDKDMLLREGNTAPRREPRQDRGSTEAANDEGDYRAAAE
ncbi:ribosome hibernation-promoting factor, HPF/YfiA family [Microvirga terrestris]|uniref:Ribosome-associated translation inhibitor RaiA n=1 Tax=Microvirga terrestris TaxID=2791024 RepID=A0ABS0HS38_9HYPH|nr:ribosome-associated translation inhibitor RaiA [Microvirga terrestris]MBF9196037.1 ribosome-associated translation inhibitor RaiA [Microvirga terrestris]